ncbi:MAG: hypothetical protein ABIJ16_00325, partial [Bacteroidota bacterium]
SYGGISIRVFANGKSTMVAATNNEYSFSQNDRVTGTVLLYLDNTTIIKLFDKNKFDCVNHKCTSIYYLTEMEQL